MRTVSRLLIVATTRRGADLARRLASALPEAETHIARRFCEGVPEARRIETPLSEVLPELFRDPSVGGLVVVLAVGATVRLLAPWLQGKDRDPAVVCLDDGGRFAVAVLSGHRGGANALAQRVAAVLDACPVITTASESDGLLTVDLLGAASGWRIEATPAALRHLAAAVINGDPVAVYQDAGETTWQTAADIPPNLHFLSDLSPDVHVEVLPRVASVARNSLRGGTPDFAAWMLVSDRALDLSGVENDAVVYRPPTLVAGVGCSRGATAADIADAVNAALAQGGLARGSLSRLATLDRRADEPGVVDFARHWGLPVTGYAAEVLARVSGPVTPSAVVASAVGTPGVCEPAALLASGAATLLVPKVKTPRATAAIARMPPGDEDA